MKRWYPLLLTPLLFAGCAAMNDTLVRMWLQDRGLGHRVNTQIREGLERRRTAAPVVTPKEPAPAFLDEG